VLSRAIKLIENTIEVGAYKNVKVWKKSGMHCETSATQNGVAQARLMLTCL